MTFRELVVLARLYESECPDVVVAWAEAQGVVPSSHAWDEREALALEEAAAGLAARGLVRPTHSGTVLATAPLDSAIQVLLRPQWRLTVFSASGEFTGIDFEVAGADKPAVLVAPDGRGGVELKYERDGKAAVTRSLESVLQRSREIVPRPKRPRRSVDATDLVNGLATSQGCLIALSVSAASAASEYMWVRAESGQYRLRMGETPDAEPVSDTELEEQVMEHCAPCLSS